MWRSLFLPLSLVHQILHKGMYNGGYFILQCIYLAHTPPLHSNILSLRLRSLHSLPDTWQPGTFPHTFTVALPVPSSDNTPTPPQVVTIPQGTLKLGPEKDPSSVPSHWKWPGCGGGQVANGAAMERHALEDETGELNTKQVG